MLWLERSYSGVKVVFEEVHEDQHFASFAALHHSVVFSFSQN